MWQQNRLLLNGVLVVHGDRQILDLFQVQFRRSARTFVHHQFVLFVVIVIVSALVRLAVAGRTVTGRALQMQVIASLRAALSAARTQIVVVLVSNVLAARQVRVSFRGHRNGRLWFAFHRSDRLLNGLLSNFAVVSALVSSHTSMRSLVSSSLRTRKVIALHDRRQVMIWVRCVAVRRAARLCVQTIALTGAVAVREVMAAGASVLDRSADMVDDRRIGFLRFVADNRTADQLIVAAGQVEVRPQQLCSLLFESFLRDVALAKLEI